MSRLNFQVSVFNAETKIYKVLWKNTWITAQFDIQNLATCNFRLIN